MYTIDEIIDFLVDLSGNDKILADSDLFSEIRIVGDDFHEMIEKYANKYNVNMTKYLWYFHTDEEGQSSIGSLFFKAPYERVKRITITPTMLVDIANKGVWTIEYPNHILPKKRYDLLINQSIVIIFFVIIILILCYKYIF